MSKDKTKTKRASRQARAGVPARFDETPWKLIDNYEARSARTIGPIRLVVRRVSWHPPAWDASAYHASNEFELGRFPTERGAKTAATRAARNFMRGPDAT